MYKALQNAIDLKNNKKITDGPWVALSGYWSKFEAILHEFALRVLIAFVLVQDFLVCHNVLLIKSGS